MSPSEKYRLAYAALKGDKVALEKLGNPQTLGELDAIMRDGFDGLDAKQRSADLTATLHELELADPTVN